MKQRHHALLFAFCLLVLSAVPLLAQSQIDLTLRGVNNWSTAASTATWSGTTGGGAVGDFHLSIAYDVATREITGGDWSVTFASGSLAGPISTGTVVLDDQGSLVSFQVTSAAVSSGTGEFAGVTSGSSTASGVLIDDAQPLDGQLSINW